MVLARISGWTKMFLAKKEFLPEVPGFVLVSGFGYWFINGGIPGFIWVLVLKKIPLPGFVPVPDNPVSFVA